MIKNGQLLFISLIEQVYQWVVENKSSIREFLSLMIVASGSTSMCKSTYRYKYQGVDMRKEQQSSTH